MDKAIELIKEFEGFRTEAYLDGVGIPTIGYGTTHWPNGSPVKMGEVVTQEQAERYLKSFIVEHILPQAAAHGALLVRHERGPASGADLLCLQPRPRFHDQRGL